MKKILVIKQGYTLEVTSWENDGDNYRTKYKTVKTIEEAKKLYKICTELFVSKNNKISGIGNSMDNKGYSTIFDYVEDNKNLFQDLKTENDILNYFKNLAYDLMGGSEYYDFRVCERVTITYSIDDIYLEEIKF